MFFRKSDSSIEGTDKSSLIYVRFVKNRAFPSVASGKNMVVK